MLASEFFPRMVSDATLPSNGYRQPADNECILWADQDFNGDSISRYLASSYCTGGPYVYEAGHEMNAYHLDKANDKLSSYACGKDVAFDFCHDTMSESCRNFKGETGVGPSKQNKTGWEDSTTTVRLYCNDPERQSAMLFNYQGCQDAQARI